MHRRVRSKRGQQIELFDCEADELMSRLQTGGIVSNDTFVRLACLQHKQESLRVLVNSKAVDVNRRDLDGFTALSMAIKYNTYPTVSILLAAGANPRTTTYGDTALHYAAKRGDPDMIRLLVGAGALPDVATFDWRGNLPLDIAAKELAEYCYERDPRSREVNETMAELAKASVGLARALYRCVSAVIHVKDVAHIIIRYVLPVKGSSWC